MRDRKVKITSLLCVVFGLDINICSFSSRYFFFIDLLHVRIHIFYISFYTTYTLYTVASVKIFSPVNQTLLTYQVTNRALGFEVFKKGIRFCSLYSENTVLVFCYQNCSDLLWEKNCSSDRENLWNSQLKAEHLKFFWYH